MKNALNLYACLGGNRAKWEGVQVTAVERDPYLADMYKERFPEDEVIVECAHEFLLHHFQDFQFIWSSPPCPTHSRSRHANPKAVRVYPDMQLYQEIIFLQANANENQKWIVENVIPYYEPLIAPQRIGRHFYWANFKIIPFETPHAFMVDSTLDQLSNFHGVDIKPYKGHQRKDKILRNLVHYDAGLNIFNQARGIYEQQDTNQLKMF